MKKYILFIYALLVIGFLGCKDWLDINHNPDAIEDLPSADRLLPAAEVGIANNLMGWNFGFGGGVWVQYWTQSYTASQFKSLCEYQPEDFNTAYTSLLREPMPDLNRIIVMTQDDENRGYYFIAEALSIFGWQIISDVWGDMPYFEAFNGSEGLLHPAQNTQQEIYADLKIRINNLLSIDLSNASIENTSVDFIFGGDMAKWKEFANSLKLKLMLRLSETGEYNNAEVLSFIQSADLLTDYSASIPGSIWDDSMEGKRHPMREFQAGGANYLSTNIIACKSFIDYLSSIGDPRINTLFSTGTKGAFFGDFSTKNVDSDGNGTSDDEESYAKANFTGSMDIPLISAWEVNFNMAEVYARAGNDAAAKASYEAGIRASLAQHGITNTSIITAGAAWQSSGSTEDKIKQITMQRWIANCNYQHIEAFMDRNRTKYPAVNEINIAADRQAAWNNFPVGELTISVEGRGTLNGNLPAAPTYPSAYIMRNNNSPSQKANVGVRVWWNQKTGK